MPRPKSVVITSEEHELFRVVPFGAGGNERQPEFKIVVEPCGIHFHYSTWDNGFRLAAPTAECPKGKSFEFTYHMSSGGEPAKIHQKLCWNGGVQYLNAPRFTKLLEPGPDQIVPYPLCKFSFFGPRSELKHYKQKSHHVPLSLEEMSESSKDRHNVIEIWLLPRGWRRGVRDEWSLFNSYLDRIDMEYWATPNPDYLDLKLRQLGNGRNLITARLFDVSDRVAIQVLTYYCKPNPELGNYMTFVENGQLMERLASQPVTCMFSDGSFAPVRCLGFLQLERNAGLIDPVEWLRWAERFASYGTTAIARKLPKMVETGKGGHVEGGKLIQDDGRILPLRFSAPSESLPYIEGFGR